MKLENANIRPASFEYIWNERLISMNTLIRFLRSMRLLTECFQRVMEVFRYHAV